MYTTTVLLSWDCLCEIVHLQHSKIQKHLLLLRFIEIFQFSLLKYLLWLEEKILPWNSKMPRCKVWLNDTHEWIVITAAQILRVWLLLRYINILKEKLIYRPNSASLPLQNFLKMNNAIFNVFHLLVTSYNVKHTIFVITLIDLHLWKILLIFFFNKDQNLRYAELVKKWRLCWKLHHCYIISTSLEYKSSGIQELSPSQQ